MIVYRRRRFATRRYRYGGSGIVDMIGSLLAVKTLQKLALMVYVC